MIPTSHIIRVPANTALVVHEFSYIDYPIVEWYLEKNSSVTLIHEQISADHAYYTNDLRFFLDEGSSLNYFPFIMGGATCDLTITLTLKAHARALVRGAYALEGHQKYSITTRQNHQGRESISDLIVSGIAAEQSDINYQGTIVVEKTAPKANASQENKTILCGSLARAISIPSLEVKINDVQCAHGSAVGPLNQDHMYYVQSRGLLPEHAQRMLLTSFFEQIVSALEDESFRERIMKQLVSRAFVTKE